MATSDEGFVQDYEPGLKQELYIYCRLCRTTFPVVFKPRPKARLRCLCGHEAPLAELDVFGSQRAAEEHAEFYEKVYRAAKNALREAGYPVPPSQRINLSTLHEQSDVVGRSSHSDEDRSDITASYQEVEDDDRRSPEAIEEDLEDFTNRLEETDGDLLAHHDVLSDLVEWAWVRRHVDEALLGRFLWACKRDIELASRIIAAAKEDLRATGRKVRLSFNSFKHLAIHFEDEGRLEDAYKVAHLAARLGLKGYKERMQRLQEQMGQA